MKHSLALITVLAFLTNHLAISATAQTAVELVGFNDLVALVGSDLEDGTGVTAAQIESAEGAAYKPDPNNALLSNTAFFDATGTNVGATGHGTTVGGRMYGTTSMASGLGQTLNPINSFDAIDFIINQTNASNGRDPEPFNFDVSNHSYILGLAGSGITNAQATNLLQRLDYICLLYTSPSPRDQRGSRMPSSA